MKLDFTDIINKAEGKVGICVATGASLKPHLENIIELSNSNEYCVVSVNDFDTMFPKLNTDYRVVANSEFSVRVEHPRFNARPETPLIFANSVDTTPKDEVSSLLTVDYLPYDQRHQNGEHCTWGSGIDGRAPCCNLIEDKRLTIQEELKKYCKTDLSYSGGDTVALHMLTMAILLGCNPIFISGVDLDYSKGYVDGTNANGAGFIEFLDRIIDHFDIIKKSADNIGVNIYSLCDGSPINRVFKFKKELT